jgi:hypothetical protein
MRSSELSRRLPKPEICLKRCDVVPSEMGRNVRVCARAGRTAMPPTSGLAETLQRTPQNDGEGPHNLWRLQID